MNKVFKKITACTLVGAIVAGSFGSYNQVNAKEADTGRKTKLENSKHFVWRHLMDFHMIAVM